MSNIKMRITIDVESGDVEEVQKVELITGEYGTRELITDAGCSPFDSSKSKEGPESLRVTRCHHTTILQTHDSPHCVYFHHRSRGWRVVCT
jgi:hypothetical protein